LNEVGGNPAAGTIAVADFHRRMKERAAKSPHGLTATATHETKRGEDARARLIALSELAEEWTQHVRGWRDLNAGLIGASGSARVPSAAHEYMLYQALLGAWPLPGIDPPFVERLAGYAIKAAREGKQQTSWLAPNEGYEAGLKAFVVRLLDPLHSQKFIESFDAFVRRIALLGALNSLTQTALKIALPGVPDFYQGSELWDLSLVDPDNRRPVDLPGRASMLSALTQPLDWAALASAWQDGRIKLALIARQLKLRRQLPEVFTNGSYRPLEVTGPDRNEIVAFARISGRDAVIVACGRQFGRATDGGRRWPSGEAWDATLAVERFSGISNVLTDAGKMTGPKLPIAALFDRLPVALLRAERVPAKGQAIRA
jgi:(1->4)-alpha-D-glucan 1-alpha-D-glucosylmutase